MRKRILKVTDVERLENTSLVSALVAAAGIQPDHLPGATGADGTCVGVTCVAVSCIGDYATVCNTAGATVQVTEDVCAPPDPTAVGCGVTGAWYCQTGSQCACLGGGTVNTLRNCPSNYCCTTQI